MLKDQVQHYLSLHEYSIFQDKDGRWKTTLPDNSKKNGRRLIARKNKDELEKQVADFYMEQEKNPSMIHSDVTLEEVYPSWIESRLLEATSRNTIKRNDQDWKRYYKDTDIVKIPMKDLNVNQLKNWAHKIIDDHNLDKKGYYNMITIMKKCFEYANDEGVCENTWAKVKINKKKLRCVEKKSNDTEIYFHDEKTEIIKYCIEDFNINSWNISDMAIPFLFMTGLRIGELAALKYEDIKENEIIICRSEVNNYIYNQEEGRFIYNGKQIVNHTKTEAGIRSVPLTDDAKKILKMVELSCKKYNYYDDGYIFCPRSQRMHSPSIDSKIYRICKKINIPSKSAHKIRKTYISQMINNGIDLDTVCRVAGHADIKTHLIHIYFVLIKKKMYMINLTIYLTIC